MAIELKKTFDLRFLTKKYKTIRVFIRFTSQLAAETACENAHY